MAHAADEHAELYRDSSGEWRWRVRARNGKTIADSGEGYVQRIDAITSLHRLVGDDIAIEYLDGEA